MGLINRQTKAISRSEKPDQGHGFFRKRQGGISIESAEGARFYGTSNSLPGRIEEAPLSPTIETIEEETKPGIVDVVISDDGNEALLHIRQVGGKIMKFTVATTPLVECEPAIRIPEE